MMAGDTYFADAASRSDGSAFVEGAGEGVRALLALHRTGAAALRIELHAPVAGEAAGLIRPCPWRGCASRNSAGERRPLRRARRPDAAARPVALLRSAELLGAASAALDAAAAYARERRQFDRAIGANQGDQATASADDWMALTTRLAGRRGRRRARCRRRPRRSATACSRPCWRSRPAGAPRRTRCRSTARWHHLECDAHLLPEARAGAWRRPCGASVLRRSAGTHLGSREDRP